MPNIGKRKHRVRPGTMKGYKPKRKHGTPYKAPALSAQDVAALANMQPVTIRHILSGDRNTPRLHPSNTGDGRMVGEYSTRSCNTPRR